MSYEVVGGTTGTGSAARLKAYSSFEPYELAEYRTALGHALPDVAIKIERMPTAVLTTRLLKEASAPEADLILGWADTAAQSPGLSGICRGGDADGFTRPTGFSTAFVVDPDLTAACGAEPVTSWRDLGQPALAGRISFADPAVSGAGFLAMSTVLQHYGNEEGWRLLQSICNNASGFPHSSWTPVAMAGEGEVAVGVSVRIAAAERVAQAPRLKLVEPTDVVGVEAEVYGVLHSTRHPKSAHRVLEWIESEEATTLFRRYRKTILSDRTGNLFMIDSARAIDDRPSNLERFGALVTPDRRE